MAIKQLSVEELKGKLDQKENFRLIDCREPNEYEICRIEGSTLIPLSEFEERATEELKKDDEIVIHCHHGGRSQQACQFLDEEGYENVTNVTGGIHAWSLKIDPSVKQY